jgi:hypothetical protein
LRTKTDCRIRPAIYLGPQDKGHRLWDPIRRQIFIGSSVVFDETSFGIDSLVSKCHDLGLCKKYNKGDFQDEIAKITDDDDPNAADYYPPPASDRVLRSNPKKTVSFGDASAPPIPVPVVQEKPREEIETPPLSITQDLFEKIPALSLPPSSSSSSSSGESSKDTTGTKEDPHIILTEDPGLVIQEENPRRSTRIRTPRRIFSADDDAHLLYAAFMARIHEPPPIRTPKGYSWVTKGPDGPAWMKAMNAEIHVQDENGTFGDLIPRQMLPELKAASTRKHFYVVDGVWKYCVKTKNGVIDKMKARFCANGSKQQCLDEEKFSPTARLATIRTVIALAAMMGATLRSGDIPGAYLNATIDDDTEVYISQPKGFEVKGKEILVSQLM